MADGARRAPKAGRVDVRPCPGPPSPRRGEESSSIALDSMVCRLVGVKKWLCGLYFLLRKISREHNTLSIVKTGRWTRPKVNDNRVAVAADGAALAVR